MVKSISEEALNQSRADRMPLTGWWQRLSVRTRDGLLIGLITLLALGSRLPGLAVFLTADEPKSWFGRGIMFLDALARADWAATFDSPAPGVTTMWAGTIGLLLEYARQGFPGTITTFLTTIPFDPLDPSILPLIRLPIVLVAVAAAVLTYWWGRPFLGKTGALLAALFIALDPFLLALSRILGHDALVTLFMWLALLAFLRAYQTPTPTPTDQTPLFQRRYLIYSGLSGGLAFLTKYPSLSLGAFLAVTMLILHLRSRRGLMNALRFWLIDIITWSLAAGLIFVVLWPVMWVEPLATVGAIFADAFRASSSPHPKGSFFLGQPVPDPGSTFYLLVTLFKTTPVLWLGWLLLIWGTISAWRSHEKMAGGRTILILLAFALFYGLLVTIGGKKQDRYILPAFPALAALAAIGYAQFIKVKRNNFNEARLRWFWLVPVILVIQLLLVIPHFPYYFTYYNPLLGGVKSASRLMIVGWGEGLDAAADWLNEQPDAENMNVVAWYSTTFEPYFRGNAIYKIDEEKISRSPKPGLAADYVVFYINQLQREIPSVGALQYFQNTPPVHVVNLKGGDYAWIYPSIGLEYIIGNEARLVGQAELLGYHLRDETGQPVSRLAPDQATVVELYWEWQGKVADEPIGLSLVDETGKIWGWGNPLGTQATLPFEQWQDGMVAHDDFALVVFPGTPPGEYELKAWIDRPATGEVVGVFPLNAEDVRLAVARPGEPTKIEDVAIEQPTEYSPVDSIELLGFSGAESLQTVWEAGETRELLLYWQANKVVSQNFPINWQLVDAAGVTRAEWTGQPANGRFPTDQWQPADLIRDPWSLTLPAYVPPGHYTLQISLGQAETFDLVEVEVAGRARTFEAPEPDLPLAANFGPSLQLLGLQGPVEGESITVTPGQPLEMALIWQAETLPDVDYTTTIQLLDDQNQVLAQRDATPLDGAAPTTSWAVGEVVVDPAALTLPDNLGSGSLRLLIALYRPDSGERLLLIDGADHLTIPVTTR